MENNLKKILKFRRVPYSGSGSCVPWFLRRLFSRYVVGRKILNNVVIKISAGNILIIWRIKFEIKNFFLFKDEFIFSFAIKFLSR